MKLAVAFAWLTKAVRSQLWNFTNEDFDTFLRSLGADSSSPQISAILGNFTGEQMSVSAILRKTSANIAQRRCRDPGSRNEIPLSHYINRINNHDHQ